MPDFLSEITGSFAQPAGENPTVAMVEAAYQAHGLNWRYLNCEVPPARLGDAVRGARAMNWAGFNCSLPNKIEVIQYLDGLGESAQIIGAVNCVVRRDGLYIGENTDGKGFVQSLTPLRSPQAARVVIFGAGGAARAIAVEMALAGATHLTIVNRSPERGQELVELIRQKTPATAEYAQWSHAYQIPAATDIVINATSIGLYPDVDAQLDIVTESLQPHMIVADVIPNPPRTRLLQMAEEQGCTTLDGLGMLVNQGVIGIRYWTGVDANPEVMRNKLMEIFGGTM